MSVHLNSVRVGCAQLLPSAASERQFSADYRDRHADNSSRKKAGSMQRTFSVTDERSPVTTNFVYFAMDRAPRIFFVVSHI